MSATSDFLEKVFKTQRMNEWRVQHTEQWQRFSDLVGSGTAASDKLNDDQRKWAKFLERTGPNPEDPFVREPPTAKNGFLKVKDYPAFGDLGDKEWEDLYNICRDTWYQMKHDTAAYAGYKNSVIQFIADNAHFFDDVSSDTMTAQATTETAIESMVDLLEKVTDSYVLSSLGISGAELPSLRRKVTDKKYNTDAEFRKKIIEISSKLSNAEDSVKRALDRVVQREFAPATKLEDYVRDKNLNIISNEYYGWSTTINSAAQVDNFKNHYFDFFEEIYSNEDVFAAFEAKEGGDKPITSAITKAKTDVDYDKTDSANYIAPKHEKEQTLAEQIQKWAGDTYDDYFKKYEELRGTRIFEHPDEVGAIVKQMDKAKIKTTDDLNKLVENSDKIQKALSVTNPKAAAAFGWLGDALKEFQGDPDMESTLKDALKSGRKLRNLASELAMRAAADGKPETVEKAKIAMELLHVIKYGNTTSKIMDTLKEDKDLFDIFGNEKLSWNKNEGVKFVTNAIDKTFRAACMGIGRGAAFVVNRFRRRNMRFNGRFTSNKMRKAHEDWEAQNTADKAAAQAAHDADVSTDPATQSEFKKSLDKGNAKRGTATAGLTGLGYAGTPEEMLRSAESDINTVLKPEEYVRQNRVDEYNQLISSLSSAQRIYEDLEQLDADELAVTTGGFTPTQETAKLQQIEAKRDKLKEDLRGIGDRGKLDLSMIGGRSDFDLFHPGLRAANLESITNYIYGATGYTGYTDAQNDLSDTQNKIAERQQHIDDYTKATADIEAAQTQIDARQKKIDEWDDKHPDVFKQLMAYWDTLQDPSLTRFGPRRASKIQEQNKDLVAQLYEQKLRGYTFS